MPLRRVCILLLLSGIFCLSQFNSIGLQCLVLFFLNGLLIILSIMNMGIKMSCYQCIFICFSLLFFQCFFDKEGFTMAIFSAVFSVLQFLCLVLFCYVPLCFTDICYNILFFLSYFLQIFFVCDYHRTYLRHIIVTKFAFVTISIIYKTLHFYISLFITYFILLILKIICFTLYSLVYFIQNFLLNSVLEVKVISIPSLEYYLFIYLPI